MSQSEYRGDELQEIAEALLREHPPGPPQTCGNRQFRRLLDELPDRVLRQGGSNGR
jgi:hypothetical protein